MHGGDENPVAWRNCCIDKNFKRSLVNISDVIKEFPNTSEEEVILKVEQAIRNVRDGLRKRIIDLNKIAAEYCLIVKKNDNESKQVIIW
jgi:hypothetical protein